MKTIDGINYELEAGDIVQHITKDEVLTKDMFVRERYEDGHVDGGWSTSYKPDKWRGSHWHKFETEMPGWVGKTYNEYEEFCIDMYGDPIEDYFHVDIVKVL